MSFGPPPTAFGDPAAAAWTAPSEIGRKLFEAKGREDWAAYFEALAQSRLFFEI
jgi:hypothetical protein